MKPMTEVEQLGSQKPCECGRVMTLGVGGQKMTPHGPVLTSVWSCFACGRTEDAGVINAVFKD